nr:zinc ribbon domain-containing protein [Propionibacterium sp.]
MGAATVEGPIGEGRSRIRCESGTLTLTLTEGANVTLRGQANLGRIAWPGDGTGAVDEWIVGNGSGRLDLDIVMGTATIRDAGGAESAAPEPRPAPGRCAACGEPVSGGRFCPSCGAPQPGGRCTGCGAPLPAGARFCPDCGTPA